MKGDAAASSADFEAAKQIKPSIAEEFAKLGVAGQVQELFLEELPLASAVNPDGRMISPASGGKTCRNPSANVAAKAAAIARGRTTDGCVGAVDRRSGDRQPDPGQGGRGRRLRPRQHAPSGKPDHYLLSRSLSPEFVTKDDIIEFKLDGTPVSDTRPAYLERYIHGAIYEARPDVNAVIHSHAEAVLPFSISKTPMCCVAHVASDMGSHVPVWDIDEKFGDATNLLVVNMEQGRDLAKRLARTRWC